MKRFLLFSVGILIAFVSMNAETYTHTFKKDDLTPAGGTVTLSDVEWTASQEENVSWDSKNNRGFAIGTKNSVCKSYTLSTSAFAAFTINKVTVKTCIAASGDAKMTIAVGNVKSDKMEIKATTATDYTFENINASGNIVINWTAEQRAYYIHSITIEYTIPDDMIDIEEPKFKTIPGVYTAKDSVIVETDDQSLVLYYTLDGSTPTYEGFNNKTDSTKCSKYWVIYHVLEKSIDMKVIAVKTDGDKVYQSDVVEAKYIVSPNKPYIPANEVKSGEKYAFIAKDSIVADFMYGAESGNLKSRIAANVYNKYIETIEYNAFTFTTADNGYTIQDIEGRYMYINENDVLSFAKEKPATGAIWNITINSGKATIKNGSHILYYSQEQKYFVCSSSASDDLVLPAIYMQREYPEYTITPENNSTVENLQKITITCNDGIEASDNIRVEATDGYNINVHFTCKQTDANTLEFTLDNPLKTTNNTYLWINLTGEITLAPEQMAMKMPVTERHGISTIVNYTLTGNANAAKITKVDPANGEKVKNLSYILFTFDYYAGKTDNTEISPKLYLEGSKELISLEFTTDKEEGGKVDLMQCALKVTGEIEKNGTYVLEVPDGYFVDGNGKDVKGITLKYIVEKEGTGINDVVVEGENYWVVYDLNGIRVLETEEAGQLMTLPKGLYIVNGTKRIIK